MVSLWTVTRSPSTGPRKIRSVERVLASFRNFFECLWMESPPLESSDNIWKYLLRMSIENRNPMDYSVRNILGIFGPSRVVL